MAQELVKIEQPENWIHYSSSPAQIVMKTRYQQENTSMFFKPVGLWITPEYAEQNWFDWCTSENFRTGDLNYTHDVKFAPGAKLLRLNSAEDIDRFTEEYGFSILRDLVPNYPSTRERMDGIHWKKVAETYQGILIPTYIWERRLSMHAGWYYPWDCASGCIWDADAVESITLRSDISAGYVTREFDIGVAMQKLREATEAIKEENGV